ncbi:MAG: DUF2157 domain-containing protein, partial [Desulfobacterales bacterium]|nr:DUF2157 domain-containing protein [Desulfobacterales bacterium]
MGMIRLFKNDLVREIRDWESKAIIDGDQARAICREYGMDYDAPRKRGYLVLMVLGYLFLGLTAITLVAANWEEIPRALRMAALMGLTLAVQGYGLVKFRRGEPSAGVALLFLGSLFYGASIMLIAQIYHIGEHYPDGIFYWALGVLPLVFVTRSRLNALFCLMLATLWMMVETETGFFPGAYPLFALSGIWHAWVRKDSALLFICSLIGAGIWLNLLLAWFGGGGNGFEAIGDQVPGSIALGLLLAGFAWWLMRR